MKKLSFPLALALSGLAACSGASMQDTQPSAAARTAALEYQTTGSELDGVIAAYRADAPAMLDPAACSTIEADYQAKMSALLDRMETTSATMDRYMSGAMGPGAADMSCVADAMKAEFAHHVAVACAGPDAAANGTEAAQHATTMASWSAHQRVRYEQMGGALGMMASTTSQNTWACVHEAGGGFAMGGHHWLPGQAPSTTTTSGPVVIAPGTSTTSWPMPCGTASCPCDGFDHAGAPDAGTPGGSPTPVALGQRIFQSGVGVNGQPITRTGGYGGMMMTGCASCHGFDGHGRRTMMFTSPNVTYGNLTDPAGMTEPDGTHGPVYTDDLIRRAVTQGVDPEGDALSTVMPRWQLSDDDWSALLAFLKTLH